MNDYNLYLSSGHTVKVSTKRKLEDMLSELTTDGEMVILGDCNVAVVPKEIVAYELV